MKTKEQIDRQFLVGVTRAFGGAIVFSLPILMTMEMWWLGFHIDEFRLGVLLVVMIPFLTGLSYYSGFEQTFSLKDDALDAFAAYAVGVVASTVTLLLFGVITRDMPASEIIGKVTLQAVAASIGALLAQSQLGARRDEEQERKLETGYGGELFLMAVGALYLSFNLAPTEEMLLIAQQMTPWHSLLLIAVSLAVMHAFAYSSEFRGQSAVAPGTSFLSLFLRFTVAGYVVALLISLFALWLFGTIDGQPFDEALRSVLVLGFPSAIGAAAARLVL